ncbi:hypothetical protein Patl1_29780 [Pistacia atlantica]|uniref:Uncharacterized protein n=1 Tax=Pistacia atlantica TaxID=434234 RepID=A0ACC1AAX6_9ROSI|nr:hypothetical protein Patl1_29780 [Pistacia atlantica]
MSIQFLSLSHCSSCQGLEFCTEFPGVQMLSSLLKLSTLSLSHLSFISNSPKTLASQSLLRGGGGGGGSSACIVHAGEKDAQQFEIDPDEAKAALQKLDQQLQTLSRKQPRTPKIKAKDVKLTRGPTDEEMPEISGSFLTNTAFALLIFTILYNALFYGVIKPAIDGPDDVSEAPPPSMVTESPNAAVLQSLLSVPKDSLQL